MRTKSAGPGFGLLSILLAAVGIAPLLNYGLSATSDLVISDLGISETQFGLLATVCFGCGTIGNVVFGRYSDRQPDAKLLAIVFGIAALAMAVAAIPAGYIFLLAASGIAGFAQSFPNGVTNRILVQRVPADRRIGWTGIKQSGVQVSQLVGSVGFPLLAGFIGWHGASAIGAVLAAALAVLAVRILAATPLLPAGAPRQRISAAPVAAKPDDSTRFIVFALTLFGFINGVGVQATNMGWSKPQLRLGLQGH